ncbi:MAG: hypothetical protein Q4A24_04870 [Akkermansia sp.]|nr:hypothetical protein [Akkermansia sp.]
MDITAIPNGGLNVNMKGYRRVRTYIGGPDFWHPSFQDILRDSLSPLLPVMEYNAASDSVNASYVEKSKELLCNSAPLVGGGAMGRKIPLHVVENFARSLQRLRSALADPGVDPNTRKMLEAFTLPEPTAAPELYRFVGTGKNTRMFIIWGMEHSPGSSVKAVDIDAENFFPKYLIDNGLNLKTAGVGAILLLALAGTLFYACSGDEKKVLTPPIPIEDSGTKDKDDTQPSGEEPGSDIPTSGCVPPGIENHELAESRVEAFSFDPETYTVILSPNGNKFTFTGFEKADVKEIEPGKEYTLSFKKDSVVYNYRIVIVENPAVQQGDTPETGTKTEPPTPPATGPTDTTPSSVDEGGEDNVLRTEGTVPPGIADHCLPETLLEAFSFDTQTYTAILSPNGNRFTFTGFKKATVNGPSADNEYTLSFKKDNVIFNYRIRIVEQLKPAVVKGGKLVTDENQAITGPGGEILIIPDNPNKPITYKDGTEVRTKSGEKLYVRDGNIVDGDGNPIYYKKGGELVDKNGEELASSTTTTTTSSVSTTSETPRPTPTRPNPRAEVKGGKLVGHNSEPITGEGNRIIIMPDDADTPATYEDGSTATTSTGKQIFNRNGGAEDEDGKPLYVSPDNKLTYEEQETVTTTTTTPATPEQIDELKKRKKDELRQTQSLPGGRPLSEDELNYIVDKSTENLSEGASVQEVKKALDLGAKIIIDNIKIKIQVPAELTAEHHEALSNGKYKVTVRVTPIPGRGPLSNIRVNGVVADAEGRCVIEYTPREEPCVEVEEKGKEYKVYTAPIDIK